MVKKPKMLFIIILGLIFSIPKLHSQSRFYLKPTINYKLSETHLTSVFTGQRVNSVMSTEYFEAKIKKFAPTNSINLGIGIGLLIGDNNRMELNWSQDVTGSTLNFLHHAYFEGFDIVTGDPYKSYVESSNSFTSFFFNNRFELKYYQNLSQNLSITLGAGVHYTYVNVSDDDFETSGNAINNTGDSIKFNRYISFTGDRISPFVSIGLDYKINAGKTYLFNLSSNYILGFNFIESTSHKATIYNSSDSFSYNYLTGSKGGGIYFEISREMDFSAISHNTRNVFKKIFKRNKNEEYRAVINPL